MTREEAFALIRTERVNMRAALVNVDNAHGLQTGVRLARAYLYEMGEHLAEVHGPRAVMEMLYAEADRVLIRRPFLDVEPEARIIDLVTPEDADSEINSDIAEPADSAPAEAPEPFVHKCDCARDFRLPVRRWVGKVGVALVSWGNGGGRSGE